MSGRWRWESLPGSVIVRVAGRQLLQSARPSDANPPSISVLFHPDRGGARSSANDPSSAISVRSFKAASLTQLSASGLVLQALRTGSGRPTPFVTLAGNDRYLRIGVVHCVVFARQQSPKRSSMQARDWVLTLKRAGDPTRAGGSGPACYPCVTRLDFCPGSSCSNLHQVCGFIEIS
jgi:hypothetical protein